MTDGVSTGCTSGRPRATRRRTRRRRCRPSRTRRPYPPGERSSTSSHTRVVSWWRSTSVQMVSSVAREQGVVSGATGQRVVALTAADDVVVATTIDGVIAPESMDDVSKVVAPLDPAEERLACIGAEDGDIAVRADEGVVAGNGESMFELTHSAEAGDDDTAIVRLDGDRRSEVVPRGSATAEIGDELSVAVEREVEFAEGVQSCQREVCVAVDRGDRVTEPATTILPSG